MTLTQGYCRPPSSSTGHLLRVQHTQPLKAWERGHNAESSNGQRDPGPRSEILLGSQHSPPLSTPTPRFHDLLQGPAPTSAIPEVQAQGQPRSPPARPRGPIGQELTGRGKGGAPWPAPGLRPAPENGRARGEPGPMKRQTNENGKERVGAEIQGLGG